MKQLSLIQHTNDLPIQTSLFVWLNGDSCSPLYDYEQKSVNIPIIFTINLIYLFKYHFEKNNNNNTNIQCNPTNTG